MKSRDRARVERHARRACAVRIREVSGSDLRVVVALDAAIFPDSPRVDVANRRWWIAYVDGEPAAFAGLREGSEGCYLSRAGVLPRWRRRGIHLRLIRARVRAARRLSRACAVYTYTATHNVPSANALERCGFRYWRPARPWWSDGDEGFVYWRLAPPDDV